MIEREGAGRPEISENLEKIGAILRGLPLDQCSFERNSVTGETGWHAPKRFIFRVTGQFIKLQDSNSFSYSYVRPQESAEILRAEHSEKYQSFLEETEGDMEEAMELLLDDICQWTSPDEYEVPEIFEGKWLVVSPNLDGTITEEVMSRFLEGEDKTNEKKKLFQEQPTLLVKSSLWVWCDRPHFGVIKNLPGPVKKEILYHSPELEVFWLQEYAEAQLGLSQINLIEFTEPQESTTIEVPEPVEDEEKLEIPGDSGDTSSNYCRFIGGIFKMGRPLTEEERIQLMRQKRVEGFPFSDDPLRDFEFPGSSSFGPRVLLPEGGVRIQVTTKNVKEVVEGLKRDKIKKADLEEDPPF